MARGPVLGKGDPESEESLEALFEASEERHRLRRRRTSHVYRIVERLFFVAAIILMFLAFRRFEAAVFAAFYN